MLSLQVILPVLIFFAVTFGMVGIFMWLAPSRTTQRLQALAGPGEKSPWTETIVKIAGPSPVSRRQPVTGKILPCVLNFLMPAYAVTMQA